ncbi:MAG TPA: DUF6491 family protein [Caulobacteraceae bacterium]|jgi:hypothetical protein|nr:DUF6491 family protein [Caulobacteraceae bacterium]
MIRTALVALAAAALGAGAAAPVSAAATGETCFLSSDMTNWRAVGDRQVNVEVRNREVYRLDLGFACPQLKFAGERIGVEARGGAFICQSSLADVVVPGQGAISCPVTHITRLTPDQVKALPKKERP